MKTMTRMAVILVCFFALVGTAEAIPTLQLNIGGGWYDPFTETIVTDSPTFTLYAYLYPEGTPEGDPGLATIDRDYFLSVALVPKTGPTHQALGSFSFDSTTVDVTSDMTYGVPPLEASLGGEQGWDAKDLQKHGIYETFFYEIGFRFDPDQDTSPFNTQDNPGLVPTLAGSGMYYMGFAFDVSDLVAGYNLHFDLYNIVTAGTDTDRGDFAPFSHDAETVPEPGTLMLLGSGLVGLAGLGRRRTRT